MHTVLMCLWLMQCPANSYDRKCSQYLCSDNEFCGSTTLTNYVSGTVVSKVHVSNMMVQVSACPGPKHHRRPA